VKDVRTCLETSNNVVEMRDFIEPYSVDSGQCGVGDDPSVSDTEDETCINAKAKRSCANGFFYRGQMDGQN